jgi:hypothetical protein
MARFWGFPVLALEPLAPEEGPGYLALCILVPTLTRGGP